MPTELVPLSSLRGHPDNARVGDIDVLTASLRRYGMYSPIVVNSDGVIVAGNNVAEAAERLGWTHVPVHWINVDAATAKAIMVADNRISDLADYDRTLLLEALAALPDLDGTGFDSDDLDKLIRSTSGGKGPDGDPPLDDDPGDVKIRVGWYKLCVHGEPFAAWHEALLSQAGTPKAARKLLRARLGIPGNTRSRKIEPVPDPGGPAAIPLEEVPVSELIPLAHNPRQGDVGAIAQSLARFGQYKPLVVTRDNVVIKGNHTLDAAKSLGWVRVQVVRTDLPEEEALRVSLVDNRSADLADYDVDRLRTLVASVGDYAGTGYDGEDVDDLLSGGPTRPVRVSRTTSVDIGDVKFSVDRVTFEEWVATLPEEIPKVEIARRLDLPLEHCVM